MQDGLMKMKTKEKSWEKESLKKLEEVKVEVDGKVYKAVIQKQ